jgi:hypothetical protein
MSMLGSVKYRTSFLEGFLLGNSRAAEARYRTVSLLLKRKLIREDYKARPRMGRETLPEEAAGLAEDDVENDGLSNASVLLSFYDETPNPEIRPLQKAAVYEVLSLALSSIFASVVDVLDKSGRCELSALRDAIVADKQFGKFWLASFGGAAGLPAVTELHDAMFNAETSVEMAAVGAAFYGE